jgi:hypothetical protein
MTLRSRNPWLSGMLGVCLLALAACNDTNPTNTQPADESSRDQPAALSDGHTQTWLRQDSPRLHSRPLLLLQTRARGEARLLLWYPLGRRGQDQHPQATEPAVRQE